MARHADLLNNMHEKLFGTRPFSSPDVGPGGLTDKVTVRLGAKVREAFIENADNTSDAMREALEDYAKGKGWL